MQQSFIQIPEQISDKTLFGYNQPIIFFSHIKSALASSQQLTSSTFLSQQTSTSHCIFFLFCSGIMVIAKHLVRLRKEEDAEVEELWRQLEVEELA